MAKKLLFLLNVAILWMFWVCMEVRHSETSKLQVWLNVSQTRWLGPILQAHGIWSMHQYAASSNADLNPNVIRNFAQAKSRVNDNRLALKEALLFDHWLYVNDLGKFRLLGSLETVRQLAYSYHGEIINFIDSFHLDPQTAVSLRTNVRNLKTAVFDFHKTKLLGKKVVHSHPKVRKLETQLMKRKLYSIRGLIDFVKSNKDKAGIAIVAAVVWSCALMVALPKGGDGVSTLWPTLVLYWMVPDPARFIIYLYLLYSVRDQPLKGALFTVGLEIWMAASAPQTDWRRLVGYSVIPTAVTSLCIYTLTFQPLVLKNKNNNSYYLSVTGIGRADSRLETFFKSNTPPLLSRLVLFLSVPKGYSCTKLDGVDLSHIDISWEVLNKLLLPDQLNKQLLTFSMVNNRSIRDEDANEIASTILSKDSSIEKFRIGFNYNFNVLQYFYHVLLWEKCEVKFSCKGTSTILSAIKENPKSKLKYLDIYGIHMDEDFINNAKEIMKEHDIKITSSKPEALKKNWILFLLDNHVSRFVYTGVVVSYVLLQMYLQFCGLPSGLFHFDLWRQSLGI